MDKLQMAHEFAMKLIECRATNKTEDIIRLGWEYADAMQAEADKRAEQKRKEIREMLNAGNTFIEKEGQHFDDVEWQPDWSQAPDDAIAWEYLGHGSARWHTKTKGMFRSADLFGYSGIDMFLVERPHDL